MNTHNPKTFLGKKVSTIHNNKNKENLLKSDLDEKQVIHNPHCDFRGGKHTPIAEDIEQKKFAMPTKKEDFKELKINEKNEFRFIETHSLKTNVKLDDENINLNDCKSKTCNYALEEQKEYIDQEILYWTSSLMDL